MLKRLFLGLLLCKLALACGSAANASDDANIRQLRAMAVENSARGNVDGALSHFDSAIRQAERTFGAESAYVGDIYFDAGLIALRADRYKEAGRCLNRAVELNPNSVQARLKLAEYYKKRGQYPEAKQQMRKVLSRDPMNLEARQLLAMLYQQEGEIGKATSECSALAHLLSGGRAKTEKIAFEMAPPAVAAPAPAPSSIAPVRPAVRPASTPASAAATVSSIRPTGKAAEKAEAPKPKVDKPKPEPKKPQTVKPAKDDHRNKKPKPKSSTAVADSSSSWGLQPRLKSEAILLTPVKTKKSAPKIETPTEAKAEVKVDKLPAKVEKPAPKPAATQVADEDTSGEEVGFGGETSSKPKSKPAATPAKPKPEPVQVVVAKPAPVKRGRSGGMVPPPPPVIPSFMIPPPAAVAPPPAPKPKPKPAVEKPKQQEAPAEQPKHSGEDEGDFLLDWAGKKKSK